MQLNDEKIMVEWVGKNGIDKEKFTATYNSFAVMTRLKGAGRVASRPAWPPADERREAQAQAPIMRQATAWPSRAPRTLRELFGF